MPIIIVILKVLSTDLNERGYGSLLLLMAVLLLIIALQFLEIGLLKKKGNLYRGTFFFGRLLLKEKINLQSKTKVSILKLTKRQKMAWFSIANPDLALSYYRNDITLLNNKHTEKEVLVSLDNEALANKTIQFLEENFGLIHEVYSPDFS
ncbi:hypothetical protein [Tenacibaculum amylolyticum]|uniref:hypothetical protein n=1 Tax=Tenacibaculum amylolyticum TaxID=104269 RepID=UPI0038B624CB